MLLKNPGPLLALIASFLFGISPVLTKFIVGDLPPILLAGLLYLGSALFLLIPTLYNLSDSIAELKILSNSHRRKLLGATISGGILAPIFLVLGLQKASAFEVSLLLNLESVTTTIIAWLIFKEHVGKAVWLGKFFLIAGGIIITVSPAIISSGTVDATAASASASSAASAAAANISWASILVVGACIFWGIDNNLTRDIDQLSPNLLAMIKGLVAGIFNILLAIALSLGKLSTPLSDIKFISIIISLLIGVFSYGISLVFFIKALRHIGASRTSTYFATGPFIGMLAAVFLLGENPSLVQWSACGFMVLGLLVLYRELHDHTHRHQEMLHLHGHRHGGSNCDEHHKHEHEYEHEHKQRQERQKVIPEYSHSHQHQHREMVHSHPHYPDIHHRHKH